MNVKYAVGVVLAAVVLSGCAPTGTDEGLASATHGTSSSTPSDSASASPVPAPTETATETAPETETPSAPVAPVSESTDHTALAALALLAVKGRSPMTGYDRARFGQAWLDADRNGCDTRSICTL